MAAGHHAETNMAAATRMWVFVMAAPILLVLSQKLPMDVARQVALSRPWRSTTLYART
jgi:hypothetical protein